MYINSVYGKMVKVDKYVYKIIEDLAGSTPYAF